MSIMVTKDTRLCVQGMTGREGSFHTQQCIDYGTNVVGGVTPKKGGTKHLDVPVFNTVHDCVSDTGADTSIIFVPAAFAADAILEAADAGIKLVICISEGIPALDMMRVHASLPKGVRVLGPNCPGVISPGDNCKVGIMPARIHKPGRVGVISRSGTLTYEVVWALTENGLGQTTAVGIGGDPLPGTKFVDALEMFRNDDQTEAVAIIGEIGGTDEEAAAELIGKGYPKPVAGFIAGSTAPPGKRMGHAGAIIAGGKGTAAEKIKAFEAAGIKVAKYPAGIADLLKDEIG